MNETEDRGDDVRGRNPTRRIGLSPIATAYLRTAYGLLASTVVGTGIGAVTLIVAARQYAPADIGAGSAAIALATLAGTVGSIGLGNGLMRYLPESGARARSLVSTAYAVSGGLAAFASLGMAIIFLTTGDASALIATTGGIALLIVAAVASGVTLVQDGFLVSTGQSTLMVGRVVTGGLVRLVSIIVLAPAGALGYLAAWSASLAIPVVAVIRFARKATHETHEAPTRLRLRSVFAFSAGNYALDTLGTVAPAVLPTLILAISGPAEAAYFSVPYVGAMLVHAIGRAGGVSLFAEVSRPRANLLRGGRRAMVFGVGQVVPIIIATWVFAGPVLGVFGGEYSDHAAWPLRLLVLSALPNAIASPYLTIRRVQSRFIGLFVIIGSGAAATLATALLWVPDLGAVGAAAGFLVGQGVTMLLAVVAFLVTYTRRT